MSQQIQLVLEHFNHILARDGGKVELIEASENRVRVRYSPGTNEECGDCVVAPQDLADLLGDALRRQVPGIEALEVETMGDGQPDVENPAL